jgi:nucleotide-binding universal stress UspA family protein
MKTIIIPIDFSDNAEKALKYALKLSEKLSAKVFLLHSYYTIHSNVHESLNKLDVVLQKAEKLSNEQLKEFYNKVSPDAAYNVEFISGGKSVVNEIISQVKEKNIDLVVMSTEGISSKLGRLFLDTNTSQVVEQASCPVIVIPGDTKEEHMEMKNMVYATQYLESDISNLKALAEMAVLFGSKIEVIHVSEHESEEVKQLLPEFEQRVKKEVPTIQPSFKLLQGDDVEETLENYLGNNSADLLIMSTRNRDFMDNLFEKSITKSMAQYLSIPLMVFHHNVK